MTIGPSNDFALGLCLDPNNIHDYYTNDDDNDDYDDDDYDDDIDFDDDSRGDL